MVGAGKFNTTPMPEPTRFLNCAIPSPGNTAPDKLYAFAIKAMALLAPGVNCRLLAGIQTGEMPLGFPQNRPLRQPIVWLRNQNFRKRL